MTRQEMVAASDADFLQRIRSTDEAVSGPAVANAFVQGASAIRSLAPLLATQDFELARRARRAMYVIVRHATRPEAKKESRAVEQALLAVLCDNAPTDRRQILWMLSEIGHDPAVKAIAGFLSSPELREDARCALIRIPGKKSTRALRAALPLADTQFRPALADALRERGETVAGYPSSSRQPSKRTIVTSGH